MQHRYGEAASRSVPRSRDVADASAREPVAIAIDTIPPAIAKMPAMRTRSVGRA
jgi:hypothetical protein